MHIHSLAEQGNAQSSDKAFRSSNSNLPIHLPPVPVRAFGASCKCPHSLATSGRLHRAAPKLRATKVQLSATESTRWRHQAIEALLRI